MPSPIQRYWLCKKFEVQDGELAGAPDEEGGMIGEPPGLGDADEGVTIGEPPGLGGEEGVLPPGLGEANCGQEEQSFAYDTGAPE
jgi:hypothetical protein